MLMYNDGVVWIVAGWRPAARYQPGGEVVHRGDGQGTGVAQTHRTATAAQTQVDTPLALCSVSNIGQVFYTDSEQYIQLVGLQTVYGRPME